MDDAVNTQHPKVVANTYVYFIISANVRMYVVIHNYTYVFCISTIKICISA